jgi:hypothetical protein
MTLHFCCAAVTDYLPPALTNPHIPCSTSRELREDEGKYFIKVETLIYVMNTEYLIFDEERKTKHVQNGVKFNIL